MTIQEFETILRQLSMDFNSGHIATDADEENNRPATCFRYYHRGIVLSLVYSTVTDKWFLIWEPYRKPKVKVEGTLADIKVTLGL